MLKDAKGARRSRTRAMQRVADTLHSLERSLVLETDPEEVVSSLLRSGLGAHRRREREGEGGRGGGGGGGRKGQEAGEGEAEEKEGGLQESGDDDPCLDFFILDCRPLGEFEACHLAVSFHLNPASLNDAEQIIELVGASRES